MATLIKWYLESKSGIVQEPLVENDRQQTGVIDRVEHEAEPPELEVGFFDNFYTKWYIL